MSPGLVIAAAVLFGFLITPLWRYPARVGIEAGTLTVTPTGLNRLWALAWQRQVPVAEVVSVWVEADAGDLRTTPKTRLPGAAIPGLIMAGTYVGPDGRDFWLTYSGKNVVVVETRNGPINRFVLQVADPEKVMRAIWDAMPAR